MKCEDTILQKKTTARLLAVASIISLIIVIIAIVLADQNLILPAFIAWITTMLISFNFIKKSKNEAENMDIENK